MWQTKYASAVPKNLGLGLNFWPCSEGYFLSGRPQACAKGGGAGGARAPPDFGRSEGAAGSGGAPPYFVPPQILRLWHTPAKYTLKLILFIKDLFIYDYN